MNETSHLLDAHEAPPSGLKETFKKYQKLKIDDLDLDSSILDFSRARLPDDVEVLEAINSSHLRSVFHRFTQQDDSNYLILEDSPVYYHRALPGLLILPSLLPSQVQRVLLSRLFHRDLSDPRHKTNLHLHYDVPYPGLSRERSSTDESVTATKDSKRSFFCYPQLSETMFQPIDPTIHRPLSISRVMQKGLRWITLGGQYDWTKKAYPEEEPPAFPSDISGLLGGVFPEMKAQAAIVNVYSPGDTLSLHRDVSEKSDRGLASISLGCDCLFVIGRGDPSDSLVVRLRSGDGVFMAQNARFAWHGVPRILPDTCPSYLSSWPADSGQYEDWRDWMSNKRINLNVRQMND